MAGLNVLRHRWLYAMVGALTLSACSVIPETRAQNTSVPPPPSARTPDQAAQPVAAPPVRAAVTGDAIRTGGDATRAVGQELRLGPDIASLPIYSAKAQDGLKAFKLSCPSLVKREDRTGLTRPEDWAQACEAAANWPADSAALFFETHMEAVQVGDGSAFATGYFEPQIRGSRTRRAGYETPVYTKPADLVDVDLGQFSDELKGKRIRGRVENGQLVQYHDRTAIEEGALVGRGLEIAYAADSVEFFFLQIQGSGRLLLPDGGVMRIGYAGQNGREYVGIGRVLRERDALAPGKASMQGIIEWLRANPAEGKALMRMNKSFIFFNELTGAGPLGAMGYAVAPRTTVAVDPKFVPMGAPVFLSMDRAEPNGIWVAQDTGGAIKGANRFDTFWGAGDEARAIAGGMSAKGQALIFLPKGTFTRLSAGQ
ncbi:murein transglycosylase A [Sphingorhabdus sp. Alg239-R122]|uniref:murein transglycosylase A n=1 Tax=Sphingorhabdus sp. Alg239-R122 TaxID=2305989 RepID=UPI0013DB286C|nr:murein transglycosylase A [Sphingorhabdus sp. Alg239-R122]